jgi:hypothetical protein
MAAAASQSIADIDFQSSALFGWQQLGERVHFIQGPSKEVVESLQQIWNAPGWIDEGPRQNLVDRMELVLRRSPNGK